MEKLLELDRELLIFLNNLGSEQWDGFWLFITKQFYWSPLFALIFYLLIRRIGWKHFGMVIVFLVLILLAADQLANLFKYTFERLRPCNDPIVKDHIRIVLQRKSFSFFSGHAGGSMASAIFFFLLFRKHHKYAFFLFLFPLIFAYSRIYLGLHFPTDILTGYFFGSLIGVVFYKIYSIFQKKYFPEL